MGRPQITVVKTCLDGLCVLPLGPQTNSHGTFEVCEATTVAMVDVRRIGWIAKLRIPPSCATCRLHC